MTPTLALDDQWRNAWSARADLFEDHRARAYADLSRAFAEDQPLPDPPTCTMTDPLIVLQSVRMAALRSRADDPWSGDPDAVRRDIALLRPEIDRALSRGLVQFTDPQRMSDLLPGLLLAAARYPGRPLRLIEIGACAGLLLLPERYRIDYPRVRWTTPQAVVQLRSELDVPPSLLDQPLEILDRVGLDLYPVDPATGYDYLRSHLWPGAPEREPRLKAALSAAADDPATVLRMDVNDGLPGLLADRVGRDTVTVVIESAMSPYLPSARLRRLGRALDAAAFRGPLVLISRTSAPANCRGLAAGVTISDLTRRWRCVYAATDLLSERSEWTADPHVIDPS